MLNMLEIYHLVSEEFIAAMPSRMTSTERMRLPACLQHPNAAALL